MMQNEDVQVQRMILLWRWDDSSITAAKRDHDANLTHAGRPLHDAMTKSTDSKVSG